MWLHRLMFVFLLFLGSSVLGDRDFSSRLQPGRTKQNYDVLEELKSYNDTTTQEAAEDKHLLREAVLDVAYYLRRFKFSGYDPRYLSRGEEPKQNFFIEFPSPPLRNIHWEVKKNCEPSFGECVKYLQEQVSQTLLPRHLDSLTITKQNGWSFIKDGDLIKSADEECLKRLKNDEQTFTVFSGPVQRFQWLTSASYYMCFYTMLETGPLRTFSEDCDNFASCIPWDVGLKNNDVRGDDTYPFACAAYSFCPDPCCPLKHLHDWSACTAANPCRKHTAADKTCTFSRKDNVDFSAMVLNEWNVSCNCEQRGMKWNSRAGMCVDIDECAEEGPLCEIPAESCRNLPGAYKCVCSQMGYRSNAKSKVCEPDSLVQEVLQPTFSSLQNQTNLYFHTVRDAFNKLKLYMRGLFEREGWSDRLKFKSS